MKHHLKHMAIAGGLILAVLLVLKVDLRTALQYALLLACPLGMVGMMFMMNKSGGHGHQHDEGGASYHGDHAGHAEHAEPKAAAGHDHGAQPAAGTPPRTRDTYERID